MNEPLIEKRSCHRNKKRMYKAGLILIGPCILVLSIPPIIKSISGELNRLMVNIKSL